MRIFALCLIFQILAVHGQDALYRILLESKDFRVYDRCDGCKFVLHHDVSPGVINVTEYNNDSFSFHAAYILNSQLVMELKSQGIRHYACLAKRGSTTNMNGVDVAMVNNLFCHQQEPVTFAEACANRDKPQKDLTFLCPMTYTSMCSRVSFKYRIYVETESGEPCSALEIRKTIRHYMVLETTEESFSNQDCDGCYIFLQFTIYPSGLNVVKHGYSFPKSEDKPKFDLDSTMVNKLNSNGISFTICMKIKEPRYVNGLRAARQLAPVCHEEVNITFAKACANRYRPEKLIKLRYPAEGDVTNVTLWEKYRFYLTREFGRPCPLSGEPFQLHWGLSDIDMRGACENCTIRPAIWFLNWGASFVLAEFFIPPRTEFVHHVDVSDEQMWEFIMHGMGYSELWHRTMHPTTLSIGDAYAAYIPGKATVAQLCAGITSNRVVPCKLDGARRNICAEISYILKLSLTTVSGQPCPNETLRMLQ